MSQSPKIKLWKTLWQRAALVILVGAGCSPSFNTSADPARSSSPIQKLPKPGAVSPRLFLRLGHSSWVESLAFSPDGRMLVSSGFGQKVRVWNAQSGELQSVWPVESIAVGCLAYSPDGKTLAGALYRDKIVLWNSATGAVQRTLLHPSSGQGNGVKALVWSPDGKWLATGSDDRLIKIWDARSGRLLRDLKGHQSTVGALSVSPDGQRLLSSGIYEDTAYLWDVRSGQRLATLRFSQNNTGRIFGADWSSDGHTLALGGSVHSRDGMMQSGQVQLWDARNAALLRTVPAPKMVNSVRFSPDGRGLALLQEDGPLLLLDSQSGATQATLLAPNQGQETGDVLAFSRDGRSLSVGYRTGDVGVWSLPRSVRGGLAHPAPTLSWAATGRLKNAVVQAAVVDNGRELVASTADCGVYVWDAHSGKLKRSFSIGTESLMRQTAFSPDGKLAVTLAYRSPLQLWDLQSGRLLQELVPGEGVNTYMGRPVDVAFSPDGRTLAASVGETVGIWDVATRQQKVQTLGAGPIQFSPDGQVLALRSLSGDREGVRVNFSINGKVKLWNISSGAFHELDVARAQEVAFAPDGLSVAVKDTVEEPRSGFPSPATPPDAAHPVSVWDSRSGELLRRLSEKEGALLFAPRQFVSPGQTRFVRPDEDAVEWVDARTNETLATFQLLPQDEQSAGQTTKGTAETKAVSPVSGVTTSQWITFTSQGFYTSSGGAAKFVRWSLGSKRFPASKFASRFNRPDLVESGLRPDP